MRLSRATLRHAAPGTRLPAFDPAALRPGIVHLGIGAFHRAHQAVVTQRALAAEWGDWGIVGVSLLSPTMRDALAPQDGLYTLLARDAAGTRAEVVGTVREIVFAPDDPARVVRRIADPATRIVTLTVTEKGYCLDPATGRLDPAHPDIMKDASAFGCTDAHANAATPRSALGILVAALRAVRDAGTAPPVVVSCDNLAANGPTLRRAVADFAALLDDELSSWIAAGVRFPATMVDRIVPATADRDRAEAEALTGLHDAMPVAAEPFLQWEVEAFDGPRPRWEAGGARLGADVAAWETTKLRMLNGAHSALAYLGVLAGVETVDDAMRDDAFRAFIRTLMLREAAPTLPAGAPDAVAYAEALVARWYNPAIRHRLAQIAADGSRKLPQRLLATLADNRAVGRPTPCLLLAVAAWIRCASGRDLQGAPISTPDPLAPRMAAIGAAAGDDLDALAGGFTALDGVFGAAAARDAELRDALVTALRMLHAHGVREAALRAVAA